MVVPPPPFQCYEKELDGKRLFIYLFFLCTDWASSISGMARWKVCTTGWQEGGTAPLGFHLILFENWAGVNANNRKNKTAIKMAGAIVWNFTLDVDDNECVARRLAGCRNRWEIIHPSVHYCNYHLFSCWKYVGSRLTSAAWISRITCTTRIGYLSSKCNLFVKLSPQVIEGQSHFRDKPRNICSPQCPRYRNKQLNMYDNVIYAPFHRQDHPCPTVQSLFSRER